MAEGQSLELEGRSRSWVREVAQQFNSSVEQVGEITESQGLVPVFLDEVVKQEISNHWQRHSEGNEVGGWAVGSEREHGGHKYLHVTKFIPDPGSGTHIDFKFAGPWESGAFQYVEQRRQAGEHLVVIGTVHTHPKGWSGRITGGNRDANVFSTYEAMKGDLLSNKRSHIVMTPEDDNKLDIWQAKEIDEPWDKKLLRTGHFLLKPHPSRVRVVKSSRVRVIDKSSSSTGQGASKPSRVRVID